MGGRGDEPIRSALAEDPHLEERIEGFILALGERIDMIQEADRAGDLKAGARRLAELAEEFEVLGYPLAGEAARRAARCCETGDAQAAHERIVDLTGLVQRVRRGHRGAV